MIEGKPYTVELASAAARQLRKLDKRVARRVLLELEALRADPRPPGCRSMVGQHNRWRIRVSGANDYRVVYEIHDDQVFILVVTIAHRREVYR